MEHVEVTLLKRNGIAAAPRARPCICQRRYIRLAAAMLSVNTALT